MPIASLFGWPDASRQGALTAQDWDALRYLSLANLFSCTPAALQIYTGLPRSLAARQLRRLIRAGLVAEQHHDGDITLLLTEAGLQRLADDPLRAVAEATGGEFGDMLATGIGAQVERLHSRGGKSFGACHSCHHFQPAGNGAAHCRLLRLQIGPKQTGQICVAHQTEATALISAAARRHRRRG